MKTFSRTFLSLAVLSPTLVATATDWPQFRGPGSAGISSDETGLPVTWTARKNIIWKKALPGFGASSPITVGKRIFVTCYSGYGLNRGRPGDQESLKLHLLCFDLSSGERLWGRTIDPQLPDREYEGWLPEHGYASSTPASDGKAVYTFFGRSGVHAFDLEGNPLWNGSAGTETHGFGTAGSPLLHGQLVIINGCVESDSLIAFDKRTGKEVWRTRGINRSWCTPVLVDVPGGGKEVVVNTDGAVLGFDPDTGKRLWRCDGIDDYVCPSVIAHGGVVYALGGRSSVKALAVRAGGRGDVTATHRLWKSREGSKIPSPVYHDGYIYWVQHTGIAYCASARTGEVVYKERLQDIGPRNKTYASAVLADGRLYVVTCEGGTVVLAAKPEFEQLARNVLEDDSIFNASPAITGGRLILRSDRYLYCIGETGAGK